MAGTVMSDTTIAGHGGSTGGCCVWQITECFKSTNGTSEGESCRTHSAQQRDTAHTAMYLAHFY